jgi:hypothetical protein
MSEYHKIDTVFKRDPATKHKTLIEGAYSNPAFEYLAANAWTFTEKVDGTNIRVIIGSTTEPGFSGEDRVIIGQTVTFGGKTDEAQIPAKLVQRLQERFMVIEQRNKLTDMFPDGAVLYGEGYGMGIQAAGKHYLPHQDFALFDVRVGQFWLERHNVEDVAAKLGLDVVPILGYGTLFEMVEMTRAGFNSRWGGEHGAFPSEGIVARPRTELCDRAGKRIITKLKHKDFVRVGQR